MSYQQQIVEITITKPLFDGLPPASAHLYKMGFRDARIAAMDIVAGADAEIKQLKAQLASAQNLASHHDHEAAALAHLHGNAVDWRDELLAQNASLLAALEELLDAHQSYHVAAQAEVIGTSTALALFEKEELVIGVRAAIASAKEGR